MKNKMRSFLLIGHIASDIILLILIGIIFIIFLLGGTLAGAITGISGNEAAASENAGKLILTGFIIDLFLALIFILDIINLICGFRKKPSGKKLSIFMIIDLSLAGLLSVGIAFYFLKNAFTNISSDANSISQNILSIVIVLLILLLYLTLYILTIIFIYVPRIKNNNEVMKIE